MIQPYN